MRTSGDERIHTHTHRQRRDEALPGSIARGLRRDELGCGLEARLLQNADGARRREEQIVRGHGMRNT